MRIVAGQVRGHKLAVPKGREVRPTTDRVREALFSILGHRVQGARVLDLFAGSGALGLEALSRGAESAIFVECAKRIREVLGANIAATGFNDGRSRIVTGDALAALRGFEKERLTFDLIFLDPPYASPLLDRSLNILATTSLIESTSVIVSEHPKDNQPKSVESLRILNTRGYGDTVLSLFVRVEETPVPAKEIDV
jgi:16S rRNA (guanine966-N2)-methyltransferase